MADDNSQEDQFIKELVIYLQELKEQYWTDNTEQDPREIAKACFESLTLPFYDRWKHLSYVKKDEI